MSDEQVIACTLGAQDLQARLLRIGELGRRHLLSQRQEGRQLGLHYDPVARDEVREIVRLESECCSFLRFELTESPQAVQLTITAPAQAGEAAGWLFGHFAQGAAGPSAANCAPACGC